MGGGMGGLNLAALLTHEGKRVLVLEKSGRDRLGGRAASGKIGNAAIDNGIKGLILAGTQDEIYRRIGKTMPENVCRWTNSGQVHMNGEWRKLDDIVRGSLAEFFKVYVNTAKKWSYEEIEKLDDVSVERFVTRMIEAPVVVSAVAIWDIFNILSEDDLSPGTQIACDTSIARR